MTTGITDVEWLDAKVCELSDALDRLAASLAAKDAEIANLRADLKVKEIATDEAMTQGERQEAVIEAARQVIECKCWRARGTGAAMVLTVDPDAMNDLVDALAALAGQEAKRPK